MELSNEEMVAWVAKQWAGRPDRDDAWWERVLAIYAAGASEQSEPEVS